MVRGLTARQQQVLDHISESVKRLGRPPTLRELGARMGIASTNGVRDHLHALIKKGYIARDAYSARGIRLLRDGKPASGGSAAPGLADNEATRVRRVPVLGGVAAGQPLLADQNIEDHLVLDERMVPSQETFALRVKGDSMVEAAIYDGDYVVVRRQESAAAGDIVVALLGDEATVKRFYPEQGRVRLQPENTRLPPIIVNRDDPTLRILGKVTTVIHLMK